MPASLTVIPWTLVEISEFLGQLPVDDKKSQLNLSIASLCSELSYDPCFLWSSEVQGGSVGLNHPKLMSSEQVRQSIITPNLRKLPYDPGAQWFEEIRLGWTTTPNSCQTQPQAWFLVLCYGSKWYESHSSIGEHHSLRSYFFSQYIFNGVLRIFHSRISESFFIICTVPKEEMEHQLEITWQLQTQNLTELSKPHTAMHVQVPCVISLHTNVSFLQFSGNSRNFHLW